MIETATRLFEKQGYAATGVQQILAESGAPRGSLYFHFPGGKEELALAAIEHHSETFGALLARTLEQAPTAKVAAEWAIDALAAQIETRGCDAGCPVMAITFEVANHSEELRAASRAAFEAWAALIHARLLRDGHDEPQARSKARLLIATIEGALTLCRAYGDRGPLDDVKRHLDALLRS